jgi:choline dehydrogenase-like flavoprotein/pimeloyl-ACP methyl ester carboxylesterase
VSQGHAAREIGATAWLSRGFEQWLNERNDEPYDVVIVGSGYGGAIAAHELAGSTRNADGRAARVCILERGREYLPGMFPTRLAELPRQVRFSTERAGAPRGTREGLFDIRVGRDVSAVLANGLGGGSLINAGVMAEPADEVFENWQPGLAAQLRPYLGRARTLLEAEGQTIDRHPQGRTAKLAALQALAAVAGERARFAPASISVDMEGPGTTCLRCGDCATGCNHDAKRSLDTNLLYQAWRAKAEIYTGATVLRLEREADSWLVHTVHTDAQLRRRQLAPARLRARHVVLAAGTFGSTEILLRSQQAGLRLSEQLGRRFSANGDAIAVLYGQRFDVNAVADEAIAVEDDRKVGPTITGILDLRKDEGIVIEEIAIPGALRRVFEEVVTTVDTLHSLERPDEAAHVPDGPAQDPCAVDASAIRRSSVYVMMGDDGAEGRLRLVRPGKDGEAGDGALRVHWPGLRRQRIFARQVEVLRRLAADADTGGRVLENPVWRLLPETMASLLEFRLGPLLTVHPLGGCVIGGTRAEGVVNDKGQVFDASRPDPQAVWDTLAVLDGSIVRSSLGINPALTISALALRAVERLRDDWGYRARTARPWPPRVRPRFRAIPRPLAPRPTEVKLVERLSGAASLKALAGEPVECVVELTLRFRKHPLAALVLPLHGHPVAMARRLELERGELKVFEKKKWDERQLNGEEPSDEEVLIRASLAGSLKLLHRERSSARERRARARCAWWRNRGVRDSWQWLVERLKRLEIAQLVCQIWPRWRFSAALASRAGEARLLEYELRLSGAPTVKPESRIDAADFLAGARVLGRKRLSYEKRSNPWRQLMQLELCDFPGLAGARAPRLELDMKFLARSRVPLFKIVRQQDQVQALADVASFLAYLLRLMISIHVWSFRKPDAPAKRALQLLPGDIPGRLPKAETFQLPFEVPGGRRVFARLTRYRPQDASGRPVLMIHGYSASGTTFAHHAVRPNMAEYFCNKGREVWLLDMRTSSGMPTARDPWKFEEAALEDIPAALAEICRRTGAEKVDVFAHCMGSAMFSMAVLAAPPPPAADRYERGALPGRIGAAVLSQIAPVVVMSPANVFRGYAMGYLKRFLPFENYRFRVRPRGGVIDELTDRLLATLPYPEHEFGVENPVWPWRRTPFVGTRHRMDALYGRDFNLADKDGRALLADPVLEYIDDLFGPLSIETVSQAMHFARCEVITDYRGRNEYVLRPNLARWKFPTLSIHGGENGLSDAATQARFQRLFSEEVRIWIDKDVVAGFGHQDSLIGKRAEKIFEKVFTFLHEHRAAA